jgi:hypothetical protein
MSTHTNGPQPAAAGTALSEAELRVSTPGTAVATVVVTAREDLEIRRQVLEVLGP